MNVLSSVAWPFPQGLPFALPVEVLLLFKSPTFVQCVITITLPSCNEAFLASSLSTRHSTMVEN